MFRWSASGLSSAVPSGATNGGAARRGNSAQGRSCPPRRAAPKVLAALSLAGSLASAALVFGQSKTATTRLLLTVRGEEQLQRQGGNVILKIRLAPGVTAKLWGDQACGRPIQAAMVITNSGTYTLAFDNIPYEGKAYLCLLSSDGTLRDHMVWLDARIGSRGPQGANPTLSSEAVARSDAED